MPDIEHRQSDTESLARKLRSLEFQLTVNERLLLHRILAAAVLSGILLSVTSTATTAVDSGGSDTGAAEGTDSIRAQFDDAFTPGEEWVSGEFGDIGMVR